MARTASETPFIRRAAKMGLEQMLEEMEVLLLTELTPAQRVANEEIRTQIKSQLEKYKEGGVAQ